MIRKLIAVFLMLIGIVGIAGGVWGIYTVETNDDLTMFMAMYGLVDLAPKTNGEDNPLQQISEGVLGLASDAVDSLDNFTSQFGFKASEYLADASNDMLDFANTSNLKFNLCMYRIEVLLLGVIVLQFGLLIWAWSRK